MVYLYKCNKCSSETSIDKPMSQSSKEEYCTECEATLTRIYKLTSIKTNDGIK